MRGTFFSGGAGIVRQPRAGWTGVLVCWAVAMAGLSALSAPGFAQTCDSAAIAGVIDETGQRLRKITSDGQAGFADKIRELARRKGWSETDGEQRAYASLEDSEVRDLDEQAGTLLNKLDRLGDDGAAQGSPCERLAEAKTTAAQLIEVTTAKTVHLAAKLDAALLPETGKLAAVPLPVPTPAPPVSPSSSPTVSSAPVAVTPPRVAVAPAPPEAKPADTRIARAVPPPPAPGPGPVPRVQPQAPTWNTNTAVEGPPTSTDAVIDADAAPGVPYAPPPPVASADVTFNSEEINAAGRGFFGTMSAGLAAVFEYAFHKFGRPTGYILGEEGGGAFLAGLRYGSGTLVTKSKGERKVYWQGPSVGYDVGLAGSRVMFLVYNIEDSEEMFTRFAGLDGSAYLVGGVGITVLKKGKLLLAPIRTGLGLRFGANVGYLKFTPEPSLNPF